MGHTHRRYLRDALIQVGVPEDVVDRVLAKREGALYFNHILPEICSVSTGFPKGLKGWGPKPEPATWRWKFP